MIIGGTVIGYRLPTHKALQVRYAIDMDSLISPYTCCVRSTIDWNLRCVHELRQHVAVGVSWFASICAELERDPESSFQTYVAELCPGGILKGPFNVPARDTAGLPQSWCVICCHRSTKWY